MALCTAFFPCLLSQLFPHKPPHNFLEKVFCNILIWICVDIINNLLMGLGRRTHKPSGDIWPALGQKAVSNPSRVLHDHAMPGRHLWRRCGEGVPGTSVWGVRWWSQCCGCWLFQGRWAWCWDCWHFCSCLHCFLCNWCQEKCQRLTCPCKYFPSLYHLSVCMHMCGLFYRSNFVNR